MMRQLSTINGEVILVAAAGTRSMLAGSLGWLVHSWIHFSYGRGLVVIKTFPMPFDVKAV